MPLQFLLKFKVKITACLSLHTRYGKMQVHFTRAHRCIYIKRSELMTDDSLWVVVPKHLAERYNHGCGMQNLWGEYHQSLLKSWDMEPSSEYLRSRLTHSILGSGRKFPLIHVGSKMKHPTSQACLSEIVGSASDSGVILKVSPNTVFRILNLILNTAG